MDRVCGSARGAPIFEGRRAAGEVLVLTQRIGLAAVAALLLAGCNLILGTEPPRPLETGSTTGSGGGGAGLGGAGLGGGEIGGAPCGSTEQTQWVPTAPHAFSTVHPPSGEDIVKDGLTRLAWQAPAPAAGSPMTWQEASDLCNGLTWNGLGGFRLPTLVELASLTRYDLSPPAQDTTAFPGEQGGDFWTSTASTLVTDSAYVIAHGDGSISTRKKIGPSIGKAGVRCVHDRRPPPDKGCARFSRIYNDEAVRDAVTGLEWERVRKIEAVEWGAAKTACEALSIGSKTWRLPQVEELLSLIDVEARTDSGLDETAFGTGEAGYHYWTATPDPESSMSVWVVDMAAAVAAVGVNTQEFDARCVR